MHWTRVELSWAVSDIFCDPYDDDDDIYEGWNFNSGNYLFTTDTK